MSDIPVELTDPTADLAEAMRARMGITDDGGENDEVEDQKLEDQEPTDEVEDPNHDGAESAGSRGLRWAVPRMGADGGAEVRRRSLLWKSRMSPSSSSSAPFESPLSGAGAEQLYRWAQEQILSAPVAPPAGQQQPAPWLIPGARIQSGGLCRPGPGPRRR